MKTIMALFFLFLCGLSVRCLGQVRVVVKPAPDTISNWGKDFYKGLSMQLQKIASNDQVPPAPYSITTSVVGEQIMITKTLEGSNTNQIWQFPIPANNIRATAQILGARYANRFFGKIQGITRKKSPVRKRPSATSGAVVPLPGDVGAAFF